MLAVFVILGFFIGYMVVITFKILNRVDEVYEKVDQLRLDINDLKYDLEKRYDSNKYDDYVNSALGIPKNN